ncbi:hypothetical protein TCON_0970 [Astathelohania contejeani]|uniref:LAGLIDADG homing endonuclease n=1 Tax=Astathelohania contejeani TaxID=164912 RepID=A0ABQ7I083_9MICR|nr:hypothetical protein TCON_0970 [Thelohania contejeani]
MSVSKIILYNQVQPSSRMIVLRSIFDSVYSALEEWPRDLSKAVRTRLGRMPCGGWKKARDFFCGKFSCEVSDEEFKGRSHTIKRDAPKSNYSQSKKKDQIIEFFITYF